MPQNILEWGIALILLLQSLGDWLIGPMNVFTFTGNTEFFLLIMPAVYWCWDSRLGLRVAVILLLSLAVNLALKVIWHDPRPYWLDTRVRLLTLPEVTFGIPSAHSQNSMMVWGMLAAHLQKSLAWVAAALIILITGLSRMYLGVHFPTDVVAGWILGIIMLILFLKFEEPVASRLKNLAEIAQIGLILAVSLFYIGLGAIVTNYVGLSFMVPPEWGQNHLVQAPDISIAPFSLENIIIVAGVFFGMVGGAILFNARFTFDAGGPWLKRLERFGLGVIGVLVLWQGLGALFDLLAADESLPGYLLRYIRFTLIGGWITALAPWVFLKMKLA